MPPLTPHWTQPSHPSLLKVIHPSSTTSTEEYTSKSISLISLPPFTLFTKLSFPPCTYAPEATYATVQISREKHINLNSDLLFMNHSCEPSVILDTSTLSILTGPKGLQKGDEITFFYPSTEWSMAQGFNCFCGSKQCKGYISGAKQMGRKGLEGLWINGFIREMIEEQERLQNGKEKLKAEVGKTNGNGNVEGKGDIKLAELKLELKNALEAVENAKKALDEYQILEGGINGNLAIIGKGAVRENGVGSRELSGEMGGDTSA